MSNRNGAHKGPVRFAILGLGRIASHMGETLAAMARDDRYRDLVEPYACATRNDAGRAQKFADAYGFAHAYGSYEELLDDPEVDLVYIATPHALHKDQAVAAMEHGKNVLVEKAFALNARQSEIIIETARYDWLLCAEAMWTRYMPSRAMINDVIGSGHLGTIVQMHADLSYPVSHKARLTDPNLGGGILLDCGIYTLNFGGMIYPNASVTRMLSNVVMSPAGVDVSFQAAAVLDNGVLTSSSASMLCSSPRLGIIQGTEGYMVVHNINNPEAIDVYDNDHKLVDHLVPPEQLTGYEYEVASAARSILDGRIECQEMPHSQTLHMMAELDALRADWSMKYPGE
ncbi:MAG: Gfo/Idh/MocA family oxidoreductase [Bifidobacteriaceae bacterium]|nr:Gfo/Idh/MocA family oxidoreductase [Bifidobacteriaceae bacterium]